MNASHDDFFGDDDDDNDAAAMERERAALHRRFYAQGVREEAALAREAHVTACVRRGFRQGLRAGTHAGAALGRVESARHAAERDGLSPAEVAELHWAALQLKSSVREPVRAFGGERALCDALERAPSWHDMRMPWQAHVERADAAVARFGPRE